MISVSSCQTSGPHYVTNVQITSCLRKMKFRYHGPKAFRVLNVKPGILNSSPKVTGNYGSCAKAGVMCSKQIGSSLSYQLRN